MIIYFSVKNFRSYKNEACLNFVSASKITKMPDHEVKLGRTSILKNIGIFGSNAFGKSNILNALATMLGLIKNNKCPDNLAFLGQERQPTTFDIAFMIDDGNKYEYSFSVKKENILNPFVVTDECLYRLESNGKNELIYSKKEGLQGDVSPALSYFAQGYKEVNSQLFLKYINAPERSDPNSSLSRLLRDVYHFFLYNVFVKIDDYSQIFLVTKDNIEKVTRFLKKYDVGIEKVEFINLTNDELNTLVGDPIFQMIRNRFVTHPEIKELYANNGKEIYSIVSNNGRYRFQRMAFNHHGIDKPFCFGYESVGTQRLFALLSILFDDKNKNKTIAIDEIERSAFPGITNKVIEDFQKEYRDQWTQLVFTSHLSSLLNTVLRKDEVYFVDKNSMGESILYPLSDFKPDTRENVAREFLDGSYGAIPKIGVELNYDAD